MADAPWRCSNCGTVNEPVANACRTCGRWPSMFDLEESKVDVLGDDAATATEPPMDDFGDEANPPLPAEVTERTEGNDPTPPAEPGAPESPSMGKRRLIRRFIIPLAVVIYLLVKSIANH